MKEPMLLKRGDTLTVLKSTVKWNAQTYIGEEGIEFEWVDPASPPPDSIMQTDGRIQWYDRIINVTVMRPCVLLKVAGSLFLFAPDAERCTERGIANPLVAAEAGFIRMPRPEVEEIIPDWRKKTD